MAPGDSGGALIDYNTKNVYHGIIRGGSIADNYTSVVRWSFIDAALDLQ